MNGWKYKILLLICSAMLVMGCSREELQSDGMADGNTLIRAKISTRAATDANALGTAETVIRRVRIYAFDGNKLDKMVYREYASGEMGEAQVEMEVTQTQTKSLYVIINEPDNNAMRGRLSSINHPEGLRDVEYAMADYFNNMASTVFNSSASFDNADFCLPMYGKTADVINTVGNYPQSTPLDVPMTAIRSLARVDIYMQKDAVLSTVDLKIDAQSTINFFNTREKGYLTSLASLPSGSLTDVERTAGPATALAIPLKTTDYIAAVRAYTLYTPERSCATQDERIAFSLKGLDFGEGRIDYDKVIIGNVQGAELTQIDRNKIYKIYCTFFDRNFHLDVAVANWNTIESDYPAGGGSFWTGQPIDTRVGLNGTDADATATFTATLASNGTNVSFKWYRIKQISNDDFTLVTEEMNAGIATSGNTSNLTLTATGLNDACMVYCVATITAQDGKTDRLESNQATFMPVGDWVQSLGAYPAMQDWKNPQNAPLGSTCLLQDTRDNKVYRVKLMADGNWWMIQDLAYGNASSEDDFIDYVEGHIEPALMNIIAAQTYGLAMAEGSSTGGLFYNCHAASQVYELLPNDNKYDFHSSNMKYTLLPSFCPDGWHLPGNLNDTANWEWINLVDKTKMISARKFSYNSPSDLNAYSEDLFDNSCYFHGGYFAAKASGRAPVAYLNLGLQDSGSEILVGEALAERITNDVKASIRCIRNFK